MTEVFRNTVAMSAEARGGSGAKGLNAVVGEKGDRPRVQEVTPGARKDEVVVRHGNGATTRVRM